MSKPTIESICKNRFDDSIVSSLSRKQTKVEATGDYVTPKLSIMTSRDPLRKFTSGTFATLQRGKTLAEPTQNAKAIPRMLHHHRQKTTILLKNGLSKIESKKLLRSDSMTVTGTEQTTSSCCSDSDFSEATARTANRNNHMGTSGEFQLFITQPITA